MSIINSEWFILIIFSLIYISTFYLSRYFLRNLAKFTSDEIAEIYPHYSSVWLKYYLGLLIIILPFLLLFSVVNSIYQNFEMRVIFLFFPAFSGGMVFEGIFALRTNIYPATTKVLWNAFVLDESGSLRWIAYLQIGLGILETILSIGLFFLLK